MKSMRMDKLSCVMMMKTMMENQHISPAKIINNHRHINRSSQKTGYSKRVWNTKTTNTVMKNSMRIVNMWTRMAIQSTLR
jgi:hypothetical protein